MIKAQNQVSYNDDKDEGIWHLEFQAYPPVTEEQVSWVVIDRTKNTKATLALGDSTVDEVFSSFADIERPGDTEKPTMHKIKLKITPQYQTTVENLEYDVQFVIKVIPTKMLYFVCLSLYLASSGGSTANLFISPFHFR